jgi:hypothetical protein
VDIAPNVKRKLKKLTILTTNNMKTIKFKRQLDYTGKNGVGKQSGIEIINVGEYVTFCQVTSKGKPSDACSLRIPVENIQELIDTLKQYVPKPEYYHDVLKNHIKKGWVTGKDCKAEGKYSNEPESWRISTPDDDFLYDSQTEYLHDCHKLGIIQPGSREEEKAIQWGIMPQVSAQDRIANNFTPDQI